MNRNKNTGSILHRSYTKAHRNPALPCKELVYRMSFLLFLISFLFTSKLRAQYPVRVQVNVIQPVPPYLPQLKADIAGNRAGQLNQDISSHLSIILNYNGRAQTHIKLAGSIERVAPSPIGVSLRPDFQPAQPITMGPQQVIVSLNRDMLQSAFGNFSENSLIFNNTDLSTLRQNGVDYKLPEGTYRVCVTAYDYDKPGFSAPLSAPGTGCAYFTICYTASAPQLILPVSTMLQSNSGFQDFIPRSPQIQFIWTPPAITCGMPLGALTYNLEIRQVFEGQTVTDAQYNPFVFHQQNIPTTSFLLDTLKYAHVLVSGQKYTIRVKANFNSIPGNPLEIANQGYSQIGAFAYKPVGNPFNAIALNGTPASNAATAQGGVTVPTGGFSTTSYSPGGSSCPVPAAISNNSNISSNPTGQDLVIGAFKLHIDQATPNSDGSYNGNGYVIWHPFMTDLKLKVNFDTIKVNTDKVVYGGQVYTSMNGSYTQWSPFGAVDPVAKLTGLDNSGYESIKTRISDGAHLINQALGNDEIDFPLGLNTSLGGTPATLAIMGISFKPACTSMNVLLNINIPDMGGWLSLGGTGFQVDPNKLLLADKGGVLYLPQNHTLSLGAMAFNFDGCPNTGGNAVDTSRGSYVQWDAVNGLGKIVVNADLQFTNNNSIVAVDKNDKRLSTPFGIHAKFSFSDWSDWVASATLTNDFEIAGLPGFPIHTDGLYYDHSGKQNPSGISFPDKYKGAQDATFTGLYIPSLGMTLPADFKTFSATKPISFSFNNFILDNSGVTTTINANNILDISTGSLGGWSFSIDKISIGIVQDNFLDGMQMNGQLKLPISSTALKYTCSLNSGEGKINYQFVVQPNGQLDVPLWVAQIGLDANSSFVISNDNNGMAIKTHLNGSIGITITDSRFPKLTLPGLTFQDMAMANRNDTTVNAAAGFYFDAGKWSFSGLDLSKIAKIDTRHPGIEPTLLAGGPNAIGNNPGDFDDDNSSSSQGTVAGFSLSLSDFSPSIHPNSLTGFELGVYFNVNVNVGFGDASVVSGTTRMGILGKVDVPGGSSPTVAFDKIDITKVTLHGGIGPVTVDGELDFINGDKVYGDGIKGTLSANFPFAQLNAAAQFGSVSNFHYWAVGGSVFLQAGVPIGPGLTVNGFGGGIYHNMTLTTPDDNDIRSHDSNSPGTIPMVPQVNTTGIQAELIVAVIQPYIVNASLTLTTEIHNGSLGKMELDGNGYVITNPPANDAALVSATMKMTYDFENKIFDTYIDAQFHFLVSSANAPIWMHGGPDGDYMYVGRPDQGDNGRVSLNLIEIGSPGDVLYVDLGATAYFDAGTELPAFPPLPASISGNFDKSSNDNSVSTLLQELGKKGTPGFLFGADVHGHIRLDLLFLYAQVDAELGFDVALLKVQNPPAGCVQADGTFGLDNWYAIGQLYAYFNLDIGIHVDVWFYSGDLSLVQETASAVLQAGLPNPSWVNGEVHVKGSVLGGLISVDSDFPFSFGAQCYIPFNPLDNIQMISDIGPKDSASVFAAPYAAFSVPVDSRDYPILVPADKQHSSSYTRTFRFTESQFTLYKENNGNDSLVAGMAQGGNLATSSDGLGSTLYHNTMLQAHTKYKIYIQCYVKEVINGQNQDPAEGPITQDTTFYFTTGAAPDHIDPSNVVYTYPINNQRYVLQNEFGRQGHILTMQWQYNILPAPSKTASFLTGYDYKIYFIPGDGTDTLTTAFTMSQNNRSIDFQLPAGLKNSTIYDAQVWVIPHGIPKSAFMANVNTQSKTVTNQQQQSVQEFDKNGQVVTKKISSNASVQLAKNLVSTQPQNHVLGSIPIFTLKLQTSQYNAFAEKMAAYGKWNTKQEDNNHDIWLYSDASAAEPFDEFDMKGYQSGCSTCNQGDAGSSVATSYPALFGATVPWDNNLQNDKYASDNLYANAFLVTIAGMHVDLGASEVRDLMHPVYTLSTDAMPFQPRLQDLALSVALNAKTAVSANVTGAGANLSSGNGKANNTLMMKRAGSTPPASNNQGNTASANTAIYAGGAVINLPASYANTNTAQAKPGYMGTYLANSNAITTIVPSGPRMLWKHDEYIFADYQLLQQFAGNFLANQQNTVWLIGGSIPKALLQALAYGQDISLAVGEYGNISASPDTYSYKWNDATLTNIAQTLQALKFQPFPPTAARPLQFKYSYPFCSGCGLGSTVPEQFNYGNVIIQGTNMKVNTSDGNMIKTVPVTPAKKNTPLIAKPKAAIVIH